ncbi:hydrolase [Actinoalloteichus sp. AHMU CJ021]|uniref:cysteine hydrolase family protein n=1 Tax=Actinoalloteichus sp. AHMU CJ021 TaxID=2072503 RepID=UPI000CA05CCD|nr:hydrolase [Actinoalloteichus sp. AHMU CJ021]
MTDVLLVIDMQNGFISPKSEPVIDRVVRLVRRWDAARRPIVFTRFRNVPGSQYERLIGWTRLQGSPETDIVPELVPYAARHHVIDKTYYSTFTEEFTALASARGWTRFTIAGIATESCVMKTAADAWELGHTPVVVHDACYSHAGEEAHQAGLLVLRRFVGRRQISSIDEVCAALPTPA